MSPMTVYGPYLVDMGTQGLSAGQSQGTYWTGWVPQPSNFAVTVTAHPSTLLPGGTTHKAMRLVVTNTSVEYVPDNIVFPESRELIIHATVKNDGTYPIGSFQIIISFLTK